MLDQNLELQLDWDSADRTWPDRLDFYFLLKRLNELTANVTLAGGTGRVLDVAAAGAEHICEISLRGAGAVALDPSWAMLKSGREHVAQRNARVTFVRGIAETLPFRDGWFDRVLCHGAIDHVAAPHLAVREMIRVLAPDGRLVISGTNYASASARITRPLYRAGRRLRLVSRTDQLYWDTPLPEHTFECTYERLRRLCDPYAEFERALGVSMGVGLPGWGVLLARLPQARAVALLRVLDRAGARAPSLADFMYTVWRPRPPASWRLPLPATQGGFLVQPDDLVYPHRIGREAALWGAASFIRTGFQPSPAGMRVTNRAYTGDPARSWLDDLIARGPFRTAAVLGCDEQQYEAAWLAQGGSEQLDVYELSPTVLRNVRAGLGTLRRRARFIRADLNFAELPPDRYDVIWASGSLHHVVNLEYLYRQVARALRPGGLFALHEYVGERRLQYTPHRLARVNALLRDVPARFRRGHITEIAAPDPTTLSPFCAVRSDDILPLAEACFEPVHTARFGALFPLPFYLDLDAIARQEPALLERLEAAEAEAARDPLLRPCSAYAVFRKRG